MKKINYFLFGAAGLLLASCSQEGSAPEQQKDGDLVSFTVKLPEDMATKATTGATVGAFGTGAYATQLTALAYDNGELMEKGTATFTNLTAEVDLHLAKGKMYQIVFFAQSLNSTNVYTIDTDDAILSVDYSKMDSAGDLGDAYDCFYNMVECIPLPADGSSPETVYLSRIVAQINWGTDDIEGYAAHENAYGENGRYINSELTIEGAYTQFDLLAGDVVESSISEEAISLAPFGSPWNLTFPAGDDYDYVAMQYVLAPATSDNFDLTLSINNGGHATAGSFGKVVEVYNVPLQANYMTNIYGTLLVANFEVTVKKVELFEGAFDEADFEGEIKSEVVQTPSEE